MKASAAGLRACLERLAISRVRTVVVARLSSASAVTRAMAIELPDLVKLCMQVSVPVRRVSAALLATLPLSQRSMRLMSLVSATQVKDIRRACHRWPLGGSSGEPSATALCPEPNRQQRSLRSAMAGRHDCGPWRSGAMTMTLHRSDPAPGGQLNRSSQASAQARSVPLTMKYFTLVASVSPCMATASQLG